MKKLLRKWLGINNEVPVLRLEVGYDTWFLFTYPNTMDAEELMEVWQRLQDYLDPAFVIMAPEGVKFQKAIQS